MTFSAMNTTDLRTLLTAPTVSRATFFAHYLGTSNAAADTLRAETQPLASQPAAAVPFAYSGPAQETANR